MAKKSAAKKKSVPVKAKAAKPAKPAKAVKPAKPAAKAPVAKQKPEKPAKPAQPALMTKKGKKTEEVEKPTVKKASTIVSIIEAEPTNEDSSSKVEKISKVKPVKVDRGNLNDEKAKWVELNKKYGKDKAAVYKMTESYTSLIPLQHKVLGWGFVLTNENDRLEVLFENGIRMLISNYKS